MVSTAAAHAELANIDTFEVRPSGTARDWERLLRQAGQSSLEQSWPYGDAVVELHGAAVTRRIIAHGGQPVALVQGFRTRDFKLASINRILRGPVWLTDLPQEDKLETLRLIHREFRTRRTDLLFWLPELPDTHESRRLMGALGMRRMVTGYATAWLNLRPSEESLLGGLHGKWRNGLRTAEGAGLRIRTAGRTRIVDEALDAYDSFRRNQRFIGPPAALIRQIRQASSSAIQIWQASQSSETVAGIAMARHGASATYLAGWTGEQGRTTNAHNLLLWRAVIELHEAGIQWLDLGGIDTQTAPGLARFKLGLGGVLETQAGTYL